MPSAIAYLIACLWSQATLWAACVVSLLPTTTPYTEVKDTFDRSRYVCLLQSFMVWKSIALNRFTFQGTFYFFLRQIHWPPNLLCMECEDNMPAINIFRQTRLLIFRKYLLFSSTISIRKTKMWFRSLFIHN